MRLNEQPKYFLDLSLAGRCGMALPDMHQESVALDQIGLFERTDGDAREAGRGFRQWEISQFDDAMDRGQARNQLRARPLRQKGGRRLADESPEFAGGGYPGELLGVGQEQGIEIASDQ